MKKNLYNEGWRLVKADVDAQLLTRRYADAFNRTFKPPSTIHVIVGRLHPSDSCQFDSSSNYTIYVGEDMLVEPFIQGHYEKFNSNTGWSSRKHITPDAFSHWTWVSSHGEHLVCDLQGHCGHPGGPLLNGSTRYFLFTDPMVMTRQGQFGCGDLGEKGINNWFSHHVCNDYCRAMRIERIRPEYIQTHSQTSFPNYHRQGGVGGNGNGNGNWNGNYCQVIRR